VSGRGVWRPVYCALFGDAAFQRLSAQARLLFLVLRLGPFSSPLSIFTVYGEALPALTGLTSTEIAAAFHELERGRKPWIYRGDGLVWIRNGLRYDPSVVLTNPKHKPWIKRLVAGLPRVALVRKFTRYYRLDSLLDSLSNTHPESTLTDTLTDTDTDTVTKGQLGKRAAAVVVLDTPAAKNRGTTSNRGARSHIGKMATPMTQPEKFYGRAFDRAQHREDCPDGRQGRCFLDPLRAQCEPHRLAQTEARA